MGLLLASLLALGHALVLADRHLARMGGSRSSKRASRPSGCTGNNKGFRAETGRATNRAKYFSDTQATSRKKTIQHVLKTLHTLAICFAGACLPSTASRNAEAASQRFKTELWRFFARPELRRAPLPPSRGLLSRASLFMTNKRAKPDSGITMDDVDGFSAAELFGQGASSSASPPPPPTIGARLNRPDVPVPLLLRSCTRPEPSHVPHPHRAPPAWRPPPQACATRTTT